MSHDKSIVVMIEIFDALHHAGGSLVVHNALNEGIVAYSTTSRKRAHTHTLSLSLSLSLHL